MTSPTMTNAPLVKLPRTGLPPLTFEGQVIAHASGRAVNAPAARDNADFWEITLFALPVFPEQVTAPGYVVAVRYTNDHRGRAYHHDFADWTDDPAETLATYDPLAVLRGFPPGEQYAARQAALEANSRRQYGLLVSAVLRSFPEPLDTSPLAKAKHLTARLRAVIPTITLTGQGDKEAAADATYHAEELAACLDDIGPDLP